MTNHNLPSVEEILTEAELSNQQRNPLRQGLPAICAPANAKKGVLQIVIKIAEFPSSAARQRGMFATEIAVK